MNHNQFRPIRQPTDHANLIAIASCTSWFPEVAPALAAHFSTAKGLILDAETCVLDSMGRSDFNRLQDRARKRGRTESSGPVTLTAFDLLAEGGKSLLELPLIERKATLQELLDGMPARSALFVEDFPADTQLGQDIVLRLELEGFTANAAPARRPSGLSAAAIG